MIFKGVDIINCVDIIANISTNVRSFINDTEKNHTTLFYNNTINYS